MNTKYPETREQELNDPHNELNTWTGRREIKNERDANIELAKTARSNMSSLNDTLRAIARS